MSAIEDGACQTRPFKNDVVSIADLLLRAAQGNPARGLHLISANRDNSSEFLAYSQLDEQARRILSGLRACNAESGSKVLLILSRPHDFIPAFWACVLGGYVPCPVAPIRNDPSRWTKHFEYITTLLDQPAVIATRAIAEELQISGALDLDTLRNGTAAERIYTVKSSDAVVLMLTSGSTGNAKAVELTHGNLIASMAGKAESQPLSTSDVALNWIAFDHVAALLEVHMIALYAGATQVHTEPASVLSDPVEFLRLIDHYRVSLAFAPNFLLGQINAAIRTGRVGHSGDGKLSLDLSCLRYLVTGGEANLVQTGREFLESLAPYGLAGNTLRLAFGMTETSAASIYSKEFPLCDSGHEFGAVGRPITGFDIRIVDETGAPVPTGAAGELQVRGSMVFGCYYHNEEATRAAFTPDGWFRTGDLGCIDEGRLRLAGRSKDCIIVNGVNYFSHELEATLETLDGIERSYVAAFPTRFKGEDTEQLVVAFAISFALEEAERLYSLAVAIRNTALLLWGFRPSALLPLPKHEFPKTSLGKIQRSALRKRFEGGEFATHGAHLARVIAQQAGPFVPPNGPVENRIADVYAEILRVDRTTLSAAASFFELGGTSLEIFKLTRALLLEFRMEVPLTTILQSPTVQTLAAYITLESRQGVRAYDPIVPLQLSGTKTPLFCVHPGNGAILIFVNLAKYFANDRPFYALRPRGFNSGENCFETFEELITTYLDAIRKRQPHGPYALAGYSVGCPIVFEIAKRLELLGEQVAFLGCIDEGPSEDWEPSSLASSAGSLSYVLGLMDPKTMREVVTRLEADPVPNPCEHVFRFATPERVQELNLDLPKFSAWASVALSNHTLVRTAHVTCGSVDSMTVFCSTGWPESIPTEKWYAHLRRWDHFQRRPGQYIDVPGDHMQLMDPKHVAGFQATLRAEIDRAFGIVG